MIQDRPPSNGRLRSFAAAVICAGLVLAACGSQPAQPKVQTTPPATQAGQRWLAISANTSAKSTDPVAAFSQAASAGAKGSFVAFPWNQLEPKSGSLNVSPLKDSINYLGNTRGFTLLLGIPVINTGAKATPSDLSGQAFDSAAMKGRFHALVDKLKTAVNGNVRFMSIGNEVDVYLTAHPNEWAAYTAFFTDAIAYVHTVLPGVKVGVTTTFAGSVGGASARIATLNKASDIYNLTYYPLGASYRPRTASTAQPDLSKMVANAGGKPVVLQEVGYPSASALGATEAGQAAFFTAFLTSWKAVGGGAVPFVNIFSLHDYAASACDKIAASYGSAGDASFKAYLCSLGLRRADDSAKPAWTAVADGVKTQGP